MLINSCTGFVPLLYYIIVFKIVTHSALGEVVK